MKPALLLKAVVCCFVFFLSCNKKQNNRKTIDQVLKDNMAFRLKDLNVKNIYLLHPDGKKTKSLSLEADGFSDDALMLISNKEIQRRDSMDKYVKSWLDTSGGSASRVACSSIWKFDNVPYQVICEVYDPAMSQKIITRFDTVQVYKPTTDLMLHSQPLHFYECGAIIYGTITCKNSCGCPNCQFCTFNGGGILITGVPRPDREPDATSMTPCNSKNTCEPIPTDPTSRQSPKDSVKNKQ